MVKPEINGYFTFTKNIVFDQYSKCSEGKKNSKDYFDEIQDFCKLNLKYLKNGIFMF